MEDMKAPRGRVVVLSIGFLGLATLAAAGFAFQDRIREEYWLWKLEKGDETGRVLAVRKLGGLHSLRAVRRMLERSFRSELVNEVEAVLSSLEPDVTPLLMDLSEDEEAPDTTRMAAKIMLLRLAVSRYTAVLEAERRLSPATGPR